MWDLETQIRENLESTKLSFYIWKQCYVPVSIYKNMNCPNLFGFYNKGSICMMDNLLINQTQKLLFRKDIHSKPEKLNCYSIK